MKNIMQSLKLDINSWTLMPMILSTELLSSNIGTVLADALQRTRAALLQSNNNNNNNNESIVVLGMDAPELPLEEIISALANPTLAMFCPASDGGYGLLSVPPFAPCPQIFLNIQWSHSLTALSQLKALTDANVNVRLGRLMEDVDDAEDVIKLAQRLCQLNSLDNETKGNNNNNTATNVLWTSSGLSSSRSLLPPTTTTGSSSCTCEHTWNALVSIGVIIERDKNVVGMPKYEIREDIVMQR